MLLPLLLLLVILSSLGYVVLVFSNKQRSFSNFMVCTSVTALCLIALGHTIRFFKTPMKVDADDIYGSYVIDREMFPGPNADWQYNKYRMEIKKSGQLILFELAEGKDVVVHHMPISILEYYQNSRLKLVGRAPHHMLRRQPLLVRQPWSFYYAFNSPHYGNMYFTKGKWRPL